MAVRYYTAQRSGFHVRISVRIHERTPDPSSSSVLALTAWAREFRSAVFGAYGEWTLHTGATGGRRQSAAATMRSDHIGRSWARMGYRRPSGARALILQWYRRRMGITSCALWPVVNRWRHSRVVGLTRVASFCSSRADGTSGSAWRPEAGLRRRIFRTEAERRRGGGVVAKDGLASTRIGTGN